MRRALVIMGMIASFPQSILGQNNSGSYRFLDVPNSVFLAGLGGVNVSRVDRDVNLVTSNPSRVGDSANRHLSLNYLIYPSDIKSSNLTYSTDISNTGNWTYNLVYFDYGDFDSYDETGEVLGSFSASEYSLTASKSHTIDNYRFGANLRFAHSSISGYSSSAFLFDLGGVFIHPSRDFTVGMVFKNLGFLVSDYSETSDTKLPFDLQAGTSFRPAHMPFRFSFTAYKLTDWSTVDEEAQVSANYANPSTVDKIFRHLVVGTEVLIGRYVVGLVGYNHRRRREMKGQAGGAAGFSYGLMVRAGSFEAGYSRAPYHVGGASNTFTVTLNTRSLMNKTRKIE